MAIDELWLKGKNKHGSEVRRFREPGGGDGGAKGRRGWCRSGGRRVVVVAVVAGAALRQGKKKSRIGLLNLQISLSGVHIKGDLPGAC